MKKPSSLAILIAIPCLFTSAPAAEPASPTDQNVADEAAVEAGNLNKPYPGTKFGRHLSH